MSKQSIKETAAAGTTGGGSIAVTPSRMGDMQKRDTFKSFLKKWSNGVKNKMVLKLVGAPIKEFYDLSDVVSRLKSIEGSDQEKDNSVTYGVEDDDKNIMKITVRSDQAKDFEYRLARAMADAKDGKTNGVKTNVSLAELLFDLKDEFNIVDVEFPTIPKDVIYNADKATYGPDSSEADENDPMADSEMGSDEEMGDMGDDMDMGDTDGMDMPEGDMDADMDTGEVDDEEQPEDADEDDMELDDESVEDFPEEDESATPESILQSVMDMLKADAEAKKAQADAAAEEARARQAEFAYKSAQATVAHEEQFAQMELEMEQQKEKEKEAKKLANLAKHKVSKGNALQHKSFPMRESILGKVVRGIKLNEFDDFDTVQSIGRSKMALRVKYKIDPTDSQRIVQYKNSMLQQQLRELDAKLRAVKTRDRLQPTLSDEEQEQVQPNSRDPRAPLVNNRQVIQRR